MLKIKIVDFKKCEKVDPSFKGGVGMYFEEKDIIYLDKSLKDKSTYSRKEVEYHERAHRKIRRGGVQNHFDDLQEEAFCDLWAIYRYPKKKLSGFELMMKNMICRDDHNGRKEVSQMLKIIGVKPTRKLLDVLSPN